MKAVGAVLAFGGLLLAAYFVWLYKTYTMAPEGGMLGGMALVDPDKVQTRQNAVVFCVGVGIVGTLLYGFSRKPG